MDYVEQLRYVRITNGFCEYRVVKSLQADLNLCDDWPQRVTWLLPSSRIYALPSSKLIRNTNAFKNGSIAGIDASSIAAVEALRLQKGDIVLDLCCAPGAKLTSISDYLEQLSKIKRSNYHQNQFISQELLSKIPTKDSQSKEFNTESSSKRFSSKYKDDYALDVDNVKSQKKNITQDSVDLKSDQVFYHSHILSNTSNYEDQLKIFHKNSNNHSLFFDGDFINNELSHRKDFNQQKNDSIYPSINENNKSPLTEILNNPLPAYGLVIGMDISRNRLNICKKLLKKYKVNNTKLYIQDGSKLGLDSNPKLFYISPSLKRAHLESYKSPLKTTQAVRDGHLINDSEYSSKRGSQDPFFTTLNIINSSIISPRLVSTPGAQLASTQNVLGNERTAKGSDLHSFNCTDIFHNSDSKSININTADHLNSPEPQWTFLDYEPCFYKNDQHRFDDPIVDKTDSNYFSTPIHENSTFFDKILVDAECTHDASIRHLKKFEQKFGYEKLSSYLENPLKLNSLLSLQKNLITCAFKMLRRGGLLIYSTCSGRMEQNENIIIHLLSSFPGEAYLYPLPCGIRLNFKTEAEDVKLTTFNSLPLHYPNEINPNLPLIDNMNLKQFYENSYKIYQPLLTAAPLKIGYFTSDYNTNNKFDNTAILKDSKELRESRSYQHPKLKTHKRNTNTDKSDIYEIEPWPAFPSQLEFNPTLPRHEYAYTSGFISSLYFDQSLGQTSGLFVACIYKR